MVVRTAPCPVMSDQVLPPLRHVEVYYNPRAGDFYTAITTSSSHFGKRWWFREALSHDSRQVLAWIEKWYRMAKKHGVLNPDIASLIQSVVPINELMQDDKVEEPRGRDNGRLSRGGGSSNTLSKKVQEEMDAKLTRLKARLEGQGCGARVLAVGDVHGCIDELRALLKVGCMHSGDLTGGKACVRTRR